MGAKEPYEFRDPNELVNLLNNEKLSLGKWFAKRKFKLDEIIYDSVSSNTFRAFIHLIRKPSEVFRDWALCKLNDKDLLNRLFGRNSVLDFDNWHKEFCLDFSKYWGNVMKSPIAYGPSRKLPNLLLKEFSLWGFIKESHRAELIEYLHILLDKYTLVGIRNCVKYFQGPETIGKIPKNASMNFVKNEKTYDAIQKIYRAIGKKVGIPTIYIDILI